MSVIKSWLGDKSIPGANISFISLSVRSFFVLVNQWEQSIYYWIYLFRKKKTDRFLVDENVLLNFLVLG